MSALRDDARAIWQAAVDAVDSKRLVREAISVDGQSLVVCGERFDLGEIGRIAVIGAGKAGAGMAEGIETVLGPSLQDRLTGWVNVPADCVRPLRRITLHAARPAGVNEPTAEGVRGTEAILELVSRLNDDDLCLVLLSGGGSALMPGPASPVTLDEKQQLTRRLSAAGATIAELNTVRKQLSTVKGGRLAARITAGRTIALVISDVIGDSLDVIASGPTVPDSSTSEGAVAVLDRYLSEHEIPESVRERLRDAGPPPAVPDSVRTVVIGSNRVAVAAAAAEARRRGYDVKDVGSENAGEAAEWGKTLAEVALDARRQHSRKLCIVGGGETTVKLPASDRPRKGGRNQEIALAAIDRFWNEPADGVCVLSGGTDGEDGPTDAAGAIADVTVLAEARRRRLSPREFLAGHDSYWFFDAAGGLIKTGPTHTNVMDVQVVLAVPRQRRQWVPTHERIAARRAEEAAARPPKRSAKPNRRG